MKFPLTKEQELKLYEDWKSKKQQLSLCLTFVAPIQLAVAPQEIQEKLKRINQVLSAGQPPAPPAELPSDQNPGDKLPLEATPMAEDFVEVTYRALSAAILADRPIDFTDQAMLKASVGLLDGQTVFKDHFTSVDNWVGRVNGTVWDTATPGFPPGINANLKLDAIKDPMAVRGVLQGAIHSASVTVSFQWLPSHLDLMEQGNFFNMLGEEVDGEMVRIIVTKIDKFWEISLVWQGADQFAKQIGADGKPVQQAAAMTVMNPETEDPKSSSLESQHKLEKTQEDLAMDQLKKLLEKLMGKVTSPETFEVDFNAHVAAKVKEMEDIGNKKIAELCDQLTAANKATDESKAAHALEVKGLKPDAELGQKYLADERIEAIRLCKLVKGGKVSDAILKTLEKGELEVVQAWKSEFEKEAEAKYPAACSKCGSKEISRQSSKTEDPNPDSKEQKVIGIEAAKNLRNLHG